MEFIAVNMFFLYFIFNTLLIIFFMFATFGAVITEAFNTESLYKLLLIFYTFIFFVYLNI